MSFLAPFYLLAGLAISLPIVFHMIRRTPKGRQIFSSVRFLTPSPPRMTRRSRIEQWLLLILRGLAVLLLGLAFARPFLRAQENREDEVTIAERIVILLDRSASMRTNTYWGDALTRLEQLIGKTSAQDAVMVMTFADQTSVAMSFEDWAQTAIPARQKSVQSRAASVGPGWGSSQLGQALIEAAERVQAEAADSGIKKRVIVISDLQQGSHWEPLQAYDWPQDVSVQLERIGASGPLTNAVVEQMEPSQAAAETVPVRISNTKSSLQETFQVHWEDETTFANPDETAQQTVYLPPGQRRVVRLPVPPIERPDYRLVLTGDDVDFDNVTYFAPLPSRNLTIVYQGAPQAAEGPLSLRFFLEALFPSTPKRNVNIVDWLPDQASPPTSADEIALLLIGGELSSEQLSWTTDWLKAGGQAMFIARDPEQARSIYDLLSLPPMPVEEVRSDGYAMLEEVNFQHPVLKQFDDPRFSDFTKVRFWQYRKFDRESLPSLTPLLMFDNGAPALAEFSIEQGRLWLLASGWNRDDSDLAVWSKFVPLMNGLLDEATRQGAASTRQLKVGDELPLSELQLDASLLTVQFGDQIQSFQQDETYRFDAPGIYRFAESEDALNEGQSTRVAVNLPPAESETDPLPLELLESAGVQLAKPGLQPTEEEARAHRRQLMNHELESRQQLWRWTILVVLALLFAETLVAGWKSRKGHASQFGEA